MSVKWLVYHVLQLLPTIFTQCDLYGIRKYMVNYQQNQCRVERVLLWENTWISSYKYYNHKNIRNHKDKRTRSQSIRKIPSIHNKCFLLKDIEENSKLWKENMGEERERERVVLGGEDPLFIHPLTL